MYDCSDRSDETNCGINECNSPLLNNCEHNCVDTPTSFRCECRVGFKLVAGYKCIDIDECVETPFVCSQICENSVGSYTCKCADEYLKIDDNCKFNGEKVEPILFFTNRFYLRSISLNTNLYSLIKDGFNSASGLAYHYNKSQIFISDSDAGIIQRITISNSTLTSENIIKDGLSGVSGMCVDWVTDKLYYLLRSESKLVVSDLDGRFRLTLLNGSFLQEPTSIVCDPHEGLLFFSDWYYPAFIARLEMNGKNFSKIVTSNIGSPVGLTIDLVAKRIFWTDTHLKRIEYSNYIGESRYVVLEADSVTFPYSVAIFDGLIYWSDRSTDSIYYANALNGSNKTTLRQGTTHGVSSLSIYHFSLQRQKGHPCKINNGECSHLCLISSNESSYSCGCPDSFVLDSDNKTCKANCSSLQFKCGDERCVPFYWKCDGEVDCKDATDELNCPPKVCPRGQFTCNNSRCVYFSQLCNGFNDCYDSSDELPCQQNGCLPGRFQCPNNKKCILISKVCDGINDCGDSSDEQSCATNVCPENKFRCNSGHCIELSYFCDEEDDCPDKSDEPAYQCRNRPCPVGWVRCANNSYKCIRPSQLCDGNVDCAGGDDEQPNKCRECHPENEFKCDNKRCIPLIFK